MNSVARGDVVLPAGQILRSIDLAICAEIGCLTVTAIQRPRVAIMATGNELVPIDVEPSRGMIRNSNGTLLLASVDSLGATPIDLGICSDNPEDLSRGIQQGLQSDVLLISGGVSAGVLDLVPQQLVAAGVAELFHKVRLKPGKPLWFGAGSDQSRALVFGLPGNPVSALVCFELFVRPACHALAGHGFSTSERISARLAAPLSHPGRRSSYYPARLERGKDPDSNPGANSHTTDVVHLLSWRGSADLAALGRANALVALSEEPRELIAGDTVDVITLPT